MERAVDPLSRTGSSGEAPTLILHAGTHRTGTTSIQTVLSRNRRLLRRQRLVYPHVASVFGRRARAHHHVSQSLSCIEPDAKEKVIAFLDNVRLETRPGDKILLSAEPIYARIHGHDRLHDYRTVDYWPLRRRYLETAAEVFSGFNVCMLIFLRERNSFAQSLYYEARTRRGWTGSFSEFLVCYAPWFDYARQLELFRSVFEHVRVLNFEEACRVGLLSTFFSAIGVPMPPGADKVWLRRSVIDGEG